MIIGIHGKQYDVTFFLDKHPGGRYILEHYSGYNVTDLFEEINHSYKARAMLKKYEIKDTIKDKIKDKIILKEININDKYFSNIKSDKINLQNIKNRLITNEDKYHAHKICGVITLLNIIVRTPLSLLGIPNMNEYNMINMLTIFAQSFLLISSLSFHLPDKSRIGNEFYEYTELRYHSIIFSFRFIFIILLNYFDQCTKLNRLIIFIFCHKLSDYVSGLYKHINNGSAIRGNHNNYDIYIQISHRIASIGQFVSIIALLDITDKNPATLLNYDYNLVKYDSMYHSLNTILLNVFMMTLNRKSLLSRENRSLIYLVHILFIILFMSPIYDNLFILTILISVIGRFGLKVNKYLMYSGIYLLSYYDNINYNMIYPLFIASIYSVYKTIKL